MDGAMTVAVLMIAEKGRGVFRGPKSGSYAPIKISLV